MSCSDHQSALAINGGPKVREKPWPARGLIGPEEKAAVLALFEEACATGSAPGYDGPQEQAYCEEFAQSMGGGYADAVNSGSTALYVALKALELEPFTEVIVPPITDPGGMMPIPLLNCIPVVADAAPGSFNTGPEQVAELLSPLTSAIVVAHIAGEPANIEPIVALANRHNIPVVEDCAQAHGASINGRLVGTFGKVGAFSTMFGKHHCTGGQGGVVFTRDEATYWSIRRASDRGKPHGLTTSNGNYMASLNFNLSDLGGVIGREQLKKLPTIAANRLRAATIIREGIADCATVSAPCQVEGAVPSYWFLRLAFNAEAATCDKGAFCNALAAEGLPVGATYGAMPHLNSWFTERRVFGHSRYPWASPDYKGNPDRQFPCPNALASVAACFTVGLHENWTEEDAKDAVEILRKVDAAYRG